MNPMILGLIRHFLSVGGAALATQGYMSSEEAEAASGAAVALAAVAWSMWSKRKAR